MTRGISETQKDSADEEGLLPILNWIKRLCDHVIQTLLGADNLEFSWRHEPTIDPTIQRENLVAYVSAGMMTRRRAAEILGETLPDDPMADVLTVTTGQGVVELGANSAQNGVEKKGRKIFAHGSEISRLGKFDNDQPRGDNGRRILADAELAGDVINICVAEGVSRSTDDHGNIWYRAEYACRDGRIIIREGLNQNFVGFFLDPNG